MPCHVCGKITEYFLEKDGYSYQKCSFCGLVFVDPQPDDEYLDKEIYSEKSGYQGHKKKDLSKTKESPHARRILNFLEKKSVVGNLLDVGCSSGEFLYHAKQRGFNTCGVELNERTASIAQGNGLNVIQGELKDAHYDDDFFDTIFLGDIIEHVQDPLGLLKECYRILKPEGVLIVSTPNLDSFWAKKTFLLHKFFKMPWSVLTPPHHLYQFSKNNLEMLLRETGFGSCEWWYERPPTLKYELGSLHLWGKFKRNRTFKNFFMLIFTFGTYTKLYGLNFLLTPFLNKNFGMVIGCKKL
ncbi:hypothetical protein CL630_02550 [bacterium]|nr:hypothetical protein [bacterium]|tara:strand:- start:26844 stop:27737 length:894 start_codon:yes stop_codon:yes gene_type:complete